MTRRTIIKSLIDEQLAAANSPLRIEEGARDRVLAGPVRTMSLTLDRIEEEFGLFRRRSPQGLPSLNWTRI